MSDIYGPIDFVLVEFPGDKPLDEAADALAAIVDSGVVSLYDILAIRKEADGTFSGIDIADLGDAGMSFSAFTGARSGLVGDDDVAEAANAMEPGTVAVLLVYENSWARPFVAAARDAGGQMIASQRLPAQDVMAALDAMETA
ncbi:MAG: DUF6325 family protein [Acidimicrobiia bacterium]